MNEVELPSEAAITSLMNHKEVTKDLICSFSEIFNVIANSYDSFCKNFDDSRYKVAYAEFLDNFEKNLTSSTAPRVNDR